MKKLLAMACLLCGSAYGIEAVAKIEPLGTNIISGTVTFSQVPDGVKVVADIEGLQPGSHGFHIHEKGLCEKDGTSAGSHFNPSGMPHGSPTNDLRHAGDLGNLIADDSGKAHYERVDHVLKLDGKNSIIGKSVIIHDKLDDFKTQPTGNSGARHACGVIQAKE